VCARLPPDRTAIIRYPAPVAADEWLANDRIRGAFIGAALGDGLGALDSADLDVGNAPAPGTLVTGGATQLGLFTAESIIRMDLRFTAKGIGPAWAVIQHGLQRWAWTQGSDGPFSFVQDSSAWPDGWVVRQHSLHRTAPGFAGTLAALKSTRDVGSELAQARAVKDRPNRSDGRGALVRVGLTGTIVERERAFLAGAVAASYTHGGADGYLSGGVLSRVVAGLLAGEEPPAARQAAIQECTTWPHSSRLIASLADGSATATDAAAAIRVGLEYGLEASDVIECIRRAHKAGGTAAGVVAGVLLGARLGPSSIPASWRVAPDVIDVVEEVAQASSAANRAWVMWRDLPGWPRETTEPFEEHPACRLLGPRFPGW
jgi:ADP-ribosylglycohydrolase